MVPMHVEKNVKALHEPCLVWSPAFRRLVWLRPAKAGILLWSLCAVLLSTVPAVAEYRFDLWNAESGLPQNTVRAILQSRDGYLWVGTLDGLARFDGVRFTVFNKANSPGLPSNRVTALYEDSTGALWMALVDGGLARYQAGTFTPFGARHGLPDTPVQTISGDERGNLWVSAGALLQWKDGQFRPGFPEITAVLFTNNVLSGVRPGAIWARDQGAVHIFSRGKLTTLGLSDGLPSLRINHVDEDQHGSLWVSTEGAGLVKVRDNKVVKVYSPGDGFPHNPVNVGPIAFVAAEDREGNLWVNGVGPWLGRLKGAAFTTYPSANTSSSHPLPSSTSINALFEDAEGNVWIGSESGGLIRARERAINTVAARNGLHAVNVYPVYEDRSGAVWLGTWNLGLARVTDGAVTNFGLAPPYSLVTALCEDRQGRLWVGTYGGVVIFENGAVDTAGVPAGLSNHTVNAICQDRSGTLWFGAERGLFRYQNGELAFFTQRDGLAGRYVSVIIEGRAGALWIGSRVGLTRLADGQFTTWTERDGLPSNHVRALYEDGEGTLWIGTSDGGLGRFKEGRFTRYTTRDGMYDDGVFQILEDARGNFWMSSNRGIHRVKKQELNEFAEGRRRTITSISYGRIDGLLNAECNGGCWPAGVKTRDGKLWFPTQEGAAVIDPEAMPANLRPPPVVIESVLLDRKPVGPREGVVRVPPGKVNLEIQYTALSFINSERLQFKYRLAGWDDNWLEAGPRRAAYYSHLAPGHYTFTVLAANSDGVWNEQGASVTLVLPPAVWQTTWFRVLGAAALVGLALLFYRGRVVRLERQQAAQQEFSRRLIKSQEQERKRIATELHDSLGQNLIILKNAVHLAGEGVHNRAGTANEFGELSDLADKAIEEVRAISHALRPPELDSLGLMDALEQLVKRVCETTPVRMTFEAADLNGKLDPAFEIHFYRAVQEGIANILKHSRATTARLEIRLDGEQLLAVLRDNGDGFEAAQLPTRAGMGLASIRERVQLMGGELKLESQPGSGTTLSWRLPVCR